MAKYLVGIDEAGRGPLAGPVAVGVAVVNFDFDWNLLPGVGDSKKITAKNRAAIFGRATELKRLGYLDFMVVQSPALTIDQKGIVSAVQKAMNKALAKLEINPNDCEIRLDGSLRAPEIYTNQTTIIRGDALESVIGLASIMAKVTRDRYMERMARKTPYAPYDFAIHKGYGTKKHREMILTHGLSKLHRKSFCRNLTNENKYVSIKRD